MKKILSIILLSAFITSCTDSVQMPDPNILDMEIFVEHASSINDTRSLKEVVDIACGAVNLLDNRESYSKIVKSRYNLQDFVIHPIMSYSSRSRDADTLLYIVNYPQEQGFAIVAKHRMLQPLLGVSGAGNYNPNQTTNIPPAFGAYMDRIVNLLSQIDIKSSSMSRSFEINPFPPVEPRLEEKIIIDTLWHKRIPALIDVEWGQHFPYGEECPNKVAGCANTAVAMLLSYYEFPQKMIMTYLTNRATININWSMLKKHVRTVEYDDIKYCNSWGAQSCDDVIHLQISQICREVGYRSGTRYEYGESPTNTGGTITTLEAMGFRHIEVGDCNLRSVEKAIGYDDILLMCGKDLKTGKWHMWVCDGVQSFHLKFTRYTRRVGFNSTWNFDKQWEEPTFPFNHYNWGWDGLYNGYFTDETYFIKNGAPHYNGDVKFIKVPRP